MLKQLASRARENFNLAENSFNEMKRLVLETQCALKKFDSEYSNINEDKSSFWNKISSFFGFGESYSKRKEKLEIQAELMESVKVVNEQLGELITLISESKIGNGHTGITEKVIYDEIEALKISDHEFKDKNTIIDKVEYLNSVCAKYKNIYTRDV